MLSLILWKLTLQEVLTDIPHDPAAFVVYLLLALFIGFIWYGSRAKPKGASIGTEEVAALNAGSKETP